LPQLLRALYKNHDEHKAGEVPQVEIYRKTDGNNLKISIDGKVELTYI
jgi:hypothetical protein